MLRDHREQALGHQVVILEAPMAPRDWLPSVSPLLVLTTAYTPQIAYSSRAVSGFCMVANSRQAELSYQASLPHCDTSWPSDW